MYKKGRNTYVVLTWKRQPAKVKKWRENHGHVVFFAVRVSRIRDVGDTSRDRREI